MEEVYLGNSSDIREIDRELEELLKKQSAKIKVIGVGGGGGNSLSRMREMGITPPLAYISAINERISYDL